MFSGLCVALGNGDPGTSSRNTGKPVHILSICRETKLRKAGLTEVENIAKILLRHDPHPIKDDRFAGSQMLDQLRDWQHCHGLPLIIRLTLPFLVYIVILEKNT